MEFQVAAVGNFGVRLQYILSDEVDFIIAYTEISGVQIFASIFTEWK